MPRTPEQFEKIREEKRSQIMEVALELFSKEGYYSTPISKIAREAGISKGLMYNYFESKEELMLVVLKKGMDQLAELFDPNNDGVLTGEEFDYFVERSFEAVIKNPTYWRLYFGILMQAGIYEMINETYQSVLEDSMKLLLDYYEERGVEDPMGEALLFGAVMDGICMNYLLNPDLFPLMDLKQKIIDKFGHKE
jgi:AcrR family transcriptional regulator